jgi:hypothetical protein
MDLGDWLRGVGLGYEPAFRENEINEKVLPSLTAEDLKDLGVVIVGHRRVLLDAIETARSCKCESTTTRGDLPTVPSAEFSGTSDVGVRPRIATSSWRRCGRYS